MKQLSIFIQNKRGTLLTVLDVLKTANIQIIASTISDTQDFGIYRIMNIRKAKIEEALTAAAGFPCLRE